MSAVKIAEDYRETVDICHLEVPTRTTFQFMKTNIYKSTYPSRNGATFLGEKLAFIRQPKSQRQL